MHYVSLKIYKYFIHIYFNCILYEILMHKCANTEFYSQRFLFFFVFEIHLNFKQFNTLFSIKYFPAPPPPQ